MLIISFVEWSGAFQRPQHMALGFARRGWDVTYVSPGYVHRRGQQIESGLDLPPNLRVVTPAALPGARKLDLIGKLNEKSVLRAIANVRPDARDVARDDAWDVVIFNDPRWADVAAKVPARRRILDNMDDLSAFAPSAEWLEGKERAAREAADIIWTGTASLADRHEAAGTPARFIPCGVEGDRFANPDPAQVAQFRAEIESLFPPDKGDADDDADPDADHPRLAGYFGAINERVRPDLIEALAGEQWNVLLIGPGSTQSPKLPDSPRVQWIGLRPYASLPAWLACMDLALIPYDFEGPHRFLYPVKALEYLAGGKPVLTTPLPDIVRFLSDFVLLEDNPEGWARVARDWSKIRGDATIRAERGKGYALGRGWDAMVGEMSEDLAP